MELPPAPEGGPRRCCCCPWRAPSAVWWALLGCALGGGLAALLAILLLAAPPTAPSQSGARLVLDRPNKIMKTGKLEWYDDSRIDGVYLGPGFEYNSESHTLKIKNHGLYVVYAQLSAVHIFKSSSKEVRNATLTVHRKTAHGSDSILTLPLHLSARANQSLSAFTAVSPRQLAEGDLLYVTLTVSNPTVEGRRKSTQWYLGAGTAFGLSLIAGNCNPRATGIGGCSSTTLEVERILETLGKLFRSSA